MASVTAKDIPQIASFMQDIWGLVKKYWKVENDDKYWEALIKESSALGAKYKHRFCANMILAYLDYLEEVRSGRPSEVYWKRSSYWASVGNLDESAYWSEKAQYYEDNDHLNKGVK